MSDQTNSETFEALLEELEGIVGRLETGDLPLEAALDAYQRGVELARRGQARLTSAESRIEEIGRGMETTVLAEPSAILEDND